jgi:hypothetical protein
VSGARGVGRRVALGGAAMFALIAAEAGIAKAEELDGELLALCREAVEIHAEADRMSLAMDLPGGDTNEAWEAAYAKSGRWRDICTEIADIPARTPEGLRGKAAVLADVVALDQPLVASLCSDLLGRKVG